MPKPNNIRGAPHEVSVRIAIRLRAEYDSVINSFYSVLVGTVRWLERLRGVAQGNSTTRAHFMLVML